MNSRNYEAPNYIILSTLLFFLLVIVIKRRSMIHLLVMCV